MPDWLGTVAAVGLALAALAGYLAVVGWRLNCFYRTLLQAANRVETPLDQPSVRLAGAVYGAHMLIFLPLGLALIGVAIAPFVWVEWTAIAGLLGPKPNPFLSVPFAIIAGVPLVWILRRFIYLPKTHAALQLHRSVEPELWRLTDEAARRANTRTVDRIELDLWPTASVHERQDGLLGWLRPPRRVLTIGAPLLSGADVTLINCVLAHEYAHFAHGDTRWLWLTARIGTTVELLIHEFRLGGELNDELEGWPRLIAALNPVLWALVAYQELFWRFASGYRRFQEIRADHAAIRQSGTATFVEAMRRIEAIGSVFGGAALDDTTRAIMAGRQPANLYVAFADRFRATPAAELRRRVERLLAEQTPLRYDSHPTTAERIAFAERLAVGPPYAPTVTANTLLRDWAGYADQLHAQAVVELTKAAVNRARWAAAGY